MTCDPSRCATCEYAGAPICDPCRATRCHHCNGRAYDIHAEQFTACACAWAGHEEK